MFSKLIEYFYNDLMISDNEASQKGVTMIEYVLIAAVVAAIIIALFATLEGGITAAFTTINNALTGAQ